MDYFKATVLPLIKKDNKRSYDRRNICVYCQKPMTNIIRHMRRMHKDAKEIAELSVQPKGSNRGKILAKKLKNRGNFIHSTEAKEPILVVRRPHFQSETSIAAREYLPCKYCMGSFRRTYLWRHIKICPCNDAIRDKNKRKPIQAQAENFLFGFIKQFEAIKLHVFPIMKADDISREAKSDELICRFANRFYNSHKEKHLITLTSQKMRQLARLLMVIRQVTNMNDKSLLFFLRPKFFNAVVVSTRIVCRYDEASDKFGAPSLVHAIGTLLRHCCDVSESMLYEDQDKMDNVNNSDNRAIQLKNFKKMINRDWCYELSTTATKNLIMNKYNKPTILPLTKDISMLNNYITQIQSKACKELKQDALNITAFKTLVKTLLVQLILLNRKRSGEAQRMFIESYTSPSPMQINDEVQNSLSSEEQSLIKYFKIIIIRGKRTRGVPVLFTKEMQQSTDLLLNFRSNHVQSSNPYLFAIPHTEASCYNASKILQTYAMQCNISNPQAVTSTKLRKHVSTVAQIIHLSESDREQMSRFMGHTKKTHDEFYRQDDFIFQTAKLSKFLLLSQKGGAEKFRGRGLNDIDMDEPLSEEDDEKEDQSKDDEDPFVINKNVYDYNEQFEEDFNIDQRSTEPVTEKGNLESFTRSRIDLEILEMENCDTTKINKNKDEINEKMKKQTKDNKCSKRRWNNEEEKIMLKFFRISINSKKVPRKSECDEVIQKYGDVLKHRTVAMIKSWVQHRIKKQIV